MTSTESTGRTLRNDDYIEIAEILGRPRDEVFGPNGFIHKLTADAKDLDLTNTKISAGDIVSFTGSPISASRTNNWSESTTYGKGDFVTYDGKIYWCISDTTTTPTNTTFWKIVQHTSYQSFYYGPNSMGYPYLPIYFAAASNKAILAGLPGLGSPRYRIEKTDGSLGEIYPNDRIRLISYEKDILYTASELNSIFEPLVKHPDDTIIRPG